MRLLLTHQKADNMTAINILIAEDEAAHVRFIQRSLDQAEERFKVRVVPDLLSCREEITRCPPDVLLLDLNLPDGNALELLKELGAEISYPILVMTAGGSEALAVEALKSGALDYVVKSSETFVNIWRTVLRALREWHTREEHQEAVVALRASEEKYRQLFQEFNGLIDAVPDCFMLLAADLSIIWANQATIKLFDQPLEALVGKPCHLLWCHQDGPCDLCAAQRAFQSGKPALSVITLPDGSIFETRGIPITDSTGTVTRVISMKRDITEQKRLQDEAARTSRLAVLGELSAGVAHEINNPNALIRYNSDLLGGFLSDLLPYLQKSMPIDSNLTFGGLSSAELVEEMPRMVHSIQDSARRIKQIVDDLRDFTRQDLLTQEAFVDINQVATNCVRLVKNTIVRATDHFDVKLGRDLPPLKGIQGRIEQVVINLLINACQALTNRSQSITLSTSCSEQRDKLFLIVQDEGKGIPSDILEHIVEPFVTTKRQEGGTGLGLSVSIRVVREHRGNLDFVSTPGQGTTVTLMLPAVQEDPSHDAE
jgi:signal transduction histidine kinase/ActR/RegA family two-component response regulator